MAEPSIAERDGGGRSNNDQGWARWVARSVDALLVLPIAYGVWYAVGFYWQASIELGWAAHGSLSWVDAPMLTKVLEVAVFALLVLVIEPFFIGVAATTPGKWLMGIRVLRADGRKLGFAGALGRTFMVVTLGVALYVPFVSAIAMLLQFARIRSGQLAAWDEILNSRVVHVQRPPLVWVGVIAIVVCVRVALRWDELSARLAQ